MVKTNLNIVLLLLDIAILIILILALCGVNVSESIHYGGMIICGIVFLSAIGKWLNSPNKKENKNK